jgi:hypothetical protein
MWGQTSYSTLRHAYDGYGTAFYVFQVLENAKKTYIFGVTWLTTPPRGIKRNPEFTSQAQALQDCCSLPGMYGTPVYRPRTWWASGTRMRNFWLNCKQTSKTCQNHPWPLYTPPLDFTEAYPPAICGVRGLIQNINPCLLAFIHICNRFSTGFYEFGKSTKMCIFS